MICTRMIRALAVRGGYEDRSKKQDSDHTPILVMIFFTVVVTPDPEDGGFTVSCPALPGCHSEGETLEEALENMGDAIAGCVAVLNERAHRQGGSSSIDVSV